MSEGEVIGTSDPLKSVADALEQAVQAAKDGASDAKEAVASMADSGNLLSTLTYKACYAISYGVVFPSVLLARSIPQDNAFVHGLIDGAHAAKDMVSEMKSKKDGGEPTAV